MGDLGLIVGSNVSTPTQVSNRDRFYLNTDRSAPCNGTITRFGYCYYGRDDDSDNTYQVLVSLYRPVAGNGYINILANAVSIIKQTPRFQFPPADALLLGFNCDSIELEESVQVQEGDVIGVCLTNGDNINRLDVVSRNGDGYSMRYIEADDINDCESLPEVVDNLQETGILRILHIFAEICELPSTEILHNAHVSNLGHIL